MNLKHALSAVALGIASLSANAAIGAVAATETTPNASWTFAGGTTDVYFWFEFSGPNPSDIEVGGTIAPVGNTFSASSFYTYDKLNDELGSYVGALPGGATFLKTFTLTPGAYVFLADNNNGVGSYAGTISNLSALSAVPEPEMYAMMLAGLGVLGATARRRNKKA